MFVVWWSVSKRSLPPRGEMLILAFVYVQTNDSGLLINVKHTENSNFLLLMEVFETDTVYTIT